MAAATASMACHAAFASAAVVVAVAVVVCLPRPWPAGDRPRLPDMACRTACRSSCDQVRPGVGRAASILC